MAFDVPLDVLLVRKVGLPSRPELAMGAVGEDGVCVVNDDVVRREQVGADEFDTVAAHERGELERRARTFRRVRPRVPLTRRTAVIVDDGIATGTTVRAACQVAYAHGARRVVVAAPVAPPGALERLHEFADNLVVLEIPARFRAVGEFYDDFMQVPDDDVVRLLAHTPASR